MLLWASDLGIVELTIAYHCVFNAPGDKIVWDVSHQTYSHKVLTGRAYVWLDPEAYGKVPPYTNPEESPYDYYAIGHTSTSIALATGMAKARDLLGGSEKRVQWPSDCQSGRSMKKAQL